MKKILYLSALSAFFFACGGEEAVEEVVSAEEFRTLVITDSIGVEMGDSNYVLGAIEGVAFGSQGEIMVLDRSAACVRVFDGSGEFITRIGRRGSAPGELENPISFAVLGDGRICVCDPWRNGLHTWLPDYTYEGLKVNITNNAPALMQGASDSGFVAGQVGWEREGESIIAKVWFQRYDLQPEPTIVYQENSFELDFMDLANTLEQTLFWGSFTAEPDGDVYFALMEPDQYEIIGLRIDGTQFMTATGEVTAVEKTEQEKVDEKVWIRAKLEGWNANWGAGDFDVQPMRNQVRSLGVDGENRLWALRGTVEDPTFDVFDSESGEFLFSAQLPGIGYEGLFWNFVFSEHGILAYSDSPEFYPQIYVVELVE